MGTGTAIAVAAGLAAAVTLIVTGNGVWICGLLVLAIILVDL